MAKIKRQTVNEVASKAKTARAYATGGSAKKYGWSENILEDTAMNLSRGKAKGAEKIFGRYATPEEKKAARLMQTQRAAELTRSETRAKSVTKKAAAKAEKARTTRALTGSAKKAAPKVTKKK